MISYKNTGRIVVLAAIGILHASSIVPAESPTWSGQGRYRVLIEVPPTDLAGRGSDEMVAELPIDWQETLRKLNVTGHVDLASIHIHQYDPKSGDAIKFKTYDSARSPFDRPCRFEDNALPEDYPGRVGRSSEQNDGRPAVTVRKRKARLFNREVTQETGRIIWCHTQHNNNTSHYALYFDLTGDGHQSYISPAPWIGDVDLLRREKGEALGGFSHFTATAGDFNGDGLFDIIAGTEKGDLMWFPNRGTAGKPEFLGCRMLSDQEGPLDTGWYAAPFLCDWNADDRVDLIVGTSGNVLLWWENVGTPTEPSLRYRGFVQSDGGKLELPESPVPEDTADIFKRDYYNQPWVGDWDADGLPDLLTGGYTTGLIFFYKCLKRAEDGTPVLKYVGPLMADGKPLDTTWAAAPCAADFNGDGTLELVTGSWWWSGIREPPPPGMDDYLFYYSQGTSGLQRTPMPIEGRFPSGNIARPSVIDWNEDGLLDLLVSDNSGSIHPFINVGTATEPKWKTTNESLTIPWGFVRNFGLASSAEDVDRDGRLEAIVGSNFIKISGSPYSPTPTRCASARVDGQPIHHEGPGYGDPYYFSVLTDWNKDGNVDILWGTQQGNVYLHLSQGVSDPFTFAPGVRLRLSTGDDLRVGPPIVESTDDVTDFTILQGSRIIMAPGDFDGDGIEDLAVTETYGNIWIFLNTKQGGVDTLMPGVNVKAMSSRADALAAIDWNKDGRMDLMTGGTAARPGHVYLNESKPGKPALADGTHPLELPYLFWGPEFRSVDWNQDGDQDFIIQSEFFTFWAEASFIEHGYRRAKSVSEPQQRNQLSRRDFDTFESAALDAGARTAERNVKTQ